MGICITPGTTCRRKMTVRKQTPRSGRFISGLWCLGTVFASAEQRRKLATNAIGGKPVRARQEPDALRFEREIRVFPALAHTLTKNYKRHDLDACFGESVGFVEWSEAERNKAHSLARLGCAEM